MTEQDKQALIKHFCSRDCGDVAENCEIMPCHEIELIQEFPTTEADSDTISRAKAIDALGERPLAWEQGEYEDGMIAKWESDVEAIKTLPPAQPERIKAHWVNGRCDKCNEHAPFWAMASTYHESNFCPNCGADMRGEQDEP